MNSPSQMVHDLFCEMTVDTSLGRDRQQKQHDMNMSFPEHIMIPDVTETCESGQVDNAAIPRLTLKPRTSASPQTHEVGSWERKPAPPLFPSLHPVSPSPSHDGESTDKSDLPIARILPMPRHLLVGGDFLKKSGLSCADSSVYCFATPQNTQRKHLDSIGPTLWIPPMA